ncbi:MAG: ferritin-like domain-containing protein [Caulobacterales bacterium]
MTVQLPADSPKNTEELFARIGKMKDGGCTLDDLRILALGEAIGLALYENLAEGVENPDAKELLRQNGREEMKHAHRVAKAIEHITGEPFSIPPIEEIPFYTPLPKATVTKASLAKLAEAEFAGEDLYAAIASSFDNADAIALFKQNGKEELEHGARLVKASEFLPA